MTESSSLLERIERLESLDQIRQLPAKYALCVDMRDWDLLVELFVEDVGVPGKQRGRAALKAWYDSAMRSGDVIGSAHGVSGHIIDFEAPDLATGLVYSRNDLERADVWMIEMMSYLDRYERRDGRWYFQRRTPLFWYQCDISNPPIGDGENKLRWPGQQWQAGGFHRPFPSWEAFWEKADAYGAEEIRRYAPMDKFLATIMQGGAAPRVNPAVTRER